MLDYFVTPQLKSPVPDQNFKQMITDSTVVMDVLRPHDLTEIGHGPQSHSIAVHWKLRTWPKASLVK